MAVGQVPRVWRRPTVGRIVWDFEGHAEVKRVGRCEVCFWCEAAQPVEALLSRPSGRLVHACGSCARFLQGTNLVG